MSAVEQVPPTTSSPTFRIAQYLRESRHAVAFTGAGISTESGIPDFRSPDGIWSRHKPVLFQEFLASAEARRRYWSLRREGYPGLRAAKPNAGHLALARLEAAGKLGAVITQNIDGLHQDAGSRRVLELHGTARLCLCLDCGARHDPDAIQQRLEAGEEIPACGHCGGLLKSASVSFGQPLPRQVLSEALQLCLKSDLLLVIGSSLVVEPAASLPVEARRNGARLVIINNSETPLDGVADIILREPIGESLARVAALLGLDLQQS